MAIKTRAELKTFFETHDYPTQEQFGDLIDSMRLANEEIPISQVTNLSTVLNNLLPAAPIEGFFEGGTLEIPIVQSAFIMAVAIHTKNNEALTVGVVGDVEDEMDSFETTGNVPHIVSIERALSPTAAIVIIGDTTDAVFYSIYRIRFNFQTFL